MGRFYTFSGSRGGVRAKAYDSPLKKVRINYRNCGGIFVEIHNFLRKARDSGPSSKERLKWRRAGKFNLFKKPERTVKGISIHSLELKMVKTGK